MLSIQCRTVYTIVSSLKFKANVGLEKSQPSKKLGRAGNTFERQDSVQVLLIKILYKQTSANRYSFTSAWRTPVPLKATDASPDSSAITLLSAGLVCSACPTSACWSGQGSDPALTQALDGASFCRQTKLDVSHTEHAMPNRPNQVLKRLSDNTQRF